MSNLKSLKSKALANSDVKAEYDALETEFELINTLLRMRHAAGLTQNQVAQRMGTKEANIYRLEKGNGNPTLKTLLNYARACNCELHFGFKTT
ncbi:helix-turn-helix domain-containing protein [Photorhabdus laumondii subsp. laumondii]|uniref:Photorhabdus luminescens subsp. laumondii TTO1 complete genome segment 1/17 n=2 Tax=Photorhabdus laumondii subsp. laumondii TaxID=141679 RepID=Q7MBA1_PHOLL|nr:MULTISPECIES: helix-turn-helix transcriptional regulator [Photorhabdus]AWK40266.1 transcriptional regulator [Photorhabdus laumondii subsp. laumondii]AXG41100.1 XRE family transcriptional regulator [Photorhabdus laumondii subsp. laumondii]AXG45613.1 XRE family transcriptional regulator [Photorhabdus laumondii subsp. laumondii]KTL60880.1 XRE family transcriptional regulator [Photorhabdus laumondii subsp. laumondii]MCC8382198.1 helix-turn-helix transcriptional regulator [Photorhabdus laumondii